MDSDTRRTASLNPSDMEQYPPTLDLLLARGESEEDFGQDSMTREPLEPIRTTVEGLVEYLLTAITTLSKAKDITKAKFDRITTKLGILELSQLSGWTELGIVHVQKTESALVHKDRSAIRVLEGGTPFSFPHRTNRKRTVSMYSWVLKEVAEAAVVAGISLSAMIVASLILGLSTIDDWHDYFAEDLAELARHMQRRKVKWTPSSGQR